MLEGTLSLGLDWVGKYLGKSDVNKLKAADEMHPEMLKELVNTRAGPL